MLLVRKYPDDQTWFQFNRVPEDFAEADIPDGAELMTEAEFEKWKLSSRPPTPKNQNAEDFQIPQIVRAAQLRQWLVDADLAEVVEAMFANPDAWPDEKTRKKAQARWEYEVNIHRDDPLVVGMAHHLGLTDEQIDAAFVAANEIP